MTKGIFANRFGLVILMFVSLFASTAAFAGAGPQNVVVTNSPAQPVPMVGLVTDSDAAARKPFQWNGVFSQNPGGSSFKVSTVPANQRLVIEQVSAFCGGMLGTITLEDWKSGSFDYFQWLPANFADGNNAPASASIRFYVDPGADFNFVISNWGNAQKSCDLGVSGYFVNLP